MMKKLLYALLPLALCLMGNGSAFGQVKTYTTTINDLAVEDWNTIELFSASVINEAAGLLNASAADLTFQLVYNGNVDVAYNGNPGEVLFWVNYSGEKHNWGDGNKGFISYNSDTPNIVFTQYTMEHDKTFHITVRLANSNNQYAEFQVTINTAPAPEINVEISENIIFGGSVSYSELDADYDEKVITLSTETQAAIAAELGVADLSSVTYYGYNPTTEKLVIDYAVYDGWRSVSGDFENWSGTTAVPICVKLSDGVNFSVFNIYGATPNDYHAYWAFATDTKAVIVDFVVTITENELIISDNIIAGGSTEYVSTDNNYSEKTIVLSAETQAAIAAELGVADLSSVTHYGYNPTTGKLVIDYAGYDGWRSVSGDFANWSQTSTVPICVKFSDGVNFLVYNIQGATPDDYHAYWAFATDTKAVVVDFVVNITAPSVTWVDTATENPASVGVANVTLTRTIYSGWNTLVLPFDVNMSELNASDKNLGGGIVEAGVFNSDNIDGQDVIHILFEKISETTGTIPANTPFMLFFDDSDEEMTLTFSNVYVNVVDVPTTPGTNFDFVGTYVQGELIGANDYYVGKENSFWKSNRTRTTKGFRAFLKAKSEGAPARIAFEFDNGEATAIQTLDGEELNAEQGEWYTLAGQRIVAPAHRGLYIKNGKKYFVK